jgi:glycosyltransferase involved in cell wall biosynthesis
MNVSVIITVLNEGRSISRLLDSLLAQQRPPDEVIIVDGGSTDETVQVIETYQARLPLRLLIEPGANISRGRNIAISAAAGPIIASTDAGVRLAVDWLAQLIAPFENQINPPQVVAGFFVPDPQTPFEVAMGATVLPRRDDIKPDTFLPSSRSIAFTKAAWTAVGGYPEWLDFCEDLIFDFNLRDHVGAFIFAPEAIAYFRPRSSLRSFFKQYYQYARGDGKADLWRMRHMIRYSTYLLALPGLIGLAVFGKTKWWWLGALIGSRGLFYTPYRRLFQAWQGLSVMEKLAAAGWVPLIRLTGDLAKMIGYPVGWLWRLRRIKDDPRLYWRNNR